MKIKKQPVISWLFDENYKPTKNCEITVPNISNPNHVCYLYNGLKWLDKIRESRPDWGLPELLMSSFEKVMQKVQSPFIALTTNFFKSFTMTMFAVYFYTNNLVQLFMASVRTHCMYGYSEM